MYCAQCGEYNPDENHYCENCGAFLDAQKILEVRLKNEKHNLEFGISATPYIVGSSRLRAHGYIGSKAISRCHAQITGSGEEFYIVDLNSTNGTYVDGKKVIPGSMKKLEDGMEIRLADYIFKVELR